MDADADPIQLDAIEQRVIGSLLEKERTVPDTYPMTLNGLRTACNQTSGRDPVMHVADAEVQAALDALRARGLTRVLHPSHGARQPKYRQVLDEVLHLDGGERSVITLLLLRGAQTPGELRSRSDRLHPFADLSEVETALRSLAEREVPLVAELERRPGQKEQRWIHLLGPVDVAPVQSPEPRGMHAHDGELETLRAELAQARSELAAATAEIDRLNALLEDLTSP